MNLQLSNYLLREAVLVETEPLDKVALLKKMCHSLRASAAFADHSAPRIDEVLEAILHREKEHAASGIGSGIAIPHVRLDFIQEPAVAIAVVKHPLDFRAPDGEPARIICLALYPEANPTIALRIQAECVKLLCQPLLREALLMATDPNTVYRIFGDNKLEVERSMTARDLMRAPTCTITPSTPLRTITHLMSRNKLNDAPVLDDQQHLVGHITCGRLFNFGLPEFFSQLKSVSFIQDFDPFEKYFFQEAHACANDVMTDDYCAMPPEATILEIVFALTTQNHDQIYVLEEGKLVGVIDQILVLEQIINF